MGKRVRRIILGIAHMAFEIAQAMGSQSLVESAKAHIESYRRSAAYRPRRSTGTSPGAARDAAKSSQ